MKGYKNFDTESENNTIATSPHKNNKNSQELHKNNGNFVLPKKLKSYCKARKYLTED
jgi:hypothetical protein